jgi:hypothetical protein
VVREIFASICVQPVEDDGLVFDGSSVKVSEIRDTQEYGGFRVLLTAKRGRAGPPPRHFRPRNGSVWTCGGLAQAEVHRVTLENASNLLIYMVGVTGFEPATPKSRMSVERVLLTEIAQQTRLMTSHRSPQNEILAGSRC